MRADAGQRRAGGSGIARWSLRRAAALAVLALPLATAACHADALTAAAIDELDVATAGDQAQRLGVGVQGSPLYVVDGVVVSGGLAQQLSPDDIVSIEVLKGRAALAQWGERGVDGVIVVSTRDGGATPTGTAADRAIVRRGGTTAAAGEDGRRLVIRAPDGTGVSVAAEPLIIIDGVIADRVAMQRLSPSAIDRIEVIKGWAAAEIWGARGAHGVVRVTTK